MAVAEISWPGNYFVEFNLTLARPVCQRQAVAGVHSTFGHWLKVVGRASSSR